MGIILHHIESFASGSDFDALDSENTIVRADGVDGFPTHWSNFGDHHWVKIADNIVLSRYEGAASATTDWFTMMLQQYIGSGIDAERTLFHSTDKDIGRNWQVKINSDYDLIIVDANGTVKLNVPEYFKADNTYLFRCKCKRTNSGEFVLFINKPGEPCSEVFRLATFDSLNASGSSQQSIVIPTTVTGLEIYSSDMISMSDDGASIHTNDTMLGAGILHRYQVQDWTCRHYFTAETGTVRDSGNKDPVGNFSNTEEQPSSDTQASHIVIIQFGGDKTTGIWKDHATTGGPTGDAVENALAAQWSWRYKLDDASKTGTQFRVEYGNDVDTRVVGSWLTKSTTYNYVKHLEGYGSANEGVVPNSVDQRVAIGWGARDNNSFPQRKCFVADMYCTLFIPEPARRYVHDNAGHVRLVSA